MKLLRPVALIAAGGVAQTTLSRLPALSEHLGPVKATSFRVASRLVNTLGAGHPVRDLHALTPCGMILVSLPDSRVAPVALELETSDLNWSGRILILTDSTHDSNVFRSIAARGALVASVNVVAGLIVAEGNRIGIREFRRRLVPAATKLVRLADGGKPILLAGLTLANMTADLAAASSSCCRLAGIGAAQSRAVLKHLMTESLHAYLKAGGNALNMKWTETQWKLTREQFAALRAVRPDLAEFYSMMIVSTRKKTVADSGTDLPA